jgi:hypothetical protein
MGWADAQLDNADSLRVWRAWCMVSELSRLWGKWTKSEAPWVWRPAVV